MIYSGDAVIGHLAGKSTESDPAASSHWRKYHADFEFTGKDFKGLQGFGGHSARSGGIAWLHGLLQIPFRRMGAKFQTFPEIDAHARAITAKQARAYDLDVLRQVLTLAFLKQNLGGRPDASSTVAVIGDGFGSMTALLLATLSARHVILVNLTRTLLVDIWYLKLWLGADRFAKSVHLVADRSGLAEALSLAPGDVGNVIAIEAVNHALLGECPVDTAINIASMQEMNPTTIAQYFEDLRGAGLRRSGAVEFYCCNRESKVLPDGTETQIDAYPWAEDDHVRVDALCPWHQYFYTKRPPFYHRYDGRIRHKLVSLAAT